jgi:hypothetical protein
MNNHGSSAGATLNLLEPQASSIEHQRLQHQQRQASYNNFGEFANEYFDSIASATWGSRRGLMKISMESINKCP